ncbi:MAG: DEAD/DEAH box helicase [Actinobacteria bacterium]|nr:MAG: DEAD/DEAH box helicase [Actinomycetota bacterium]TML85184.1 MAG: DEAD/DEAH box helicase [Actinomycetota bacterium]
MQQSFRELGVSPTIVEALAARSIHDPFRIQALVLPDALAGLDVLAKSPTGSGKTLAFALPIVERTTTADARPSALVLVPTRELAAQVSAELESLVPAKGLKVAAVYGGVPLNAQAKRAKNAHVLVATPGRLQDLAERRLVDLSNIRILVLDEADRMLDMGFQPQVDRIVHRLPRNRQTMFFSATLDGPVGELARNYTNSPSRFEAALAEEQEPGEIEHRFVPVTADTKVETLVKHINSSDGLTLVFVRTKRGADKLVQKLARHDVRAVAMHGDMSQGARERALARFESGEVTTLVATDVAARGLDLDDVTHVINFDPPGEDKDYVHRTGRTGRAGRSGKAITFVLPEQQAETSHVARRLGHRAQFEEAGLQTARAKLMYTSRRGRRSKW